MIHYDEKLHLNIALIFSETLNVTDVKLNLVANHTPNEVRV